MAYLFPVQCKSHSELIEYLCDEHLITHDKLKQAMLKVDRRDFSRLNPYADAAQYIGYNCTISSPSMHAYALNELCSNLEAGSTALDIGCGSGYLLAVIAYLVHTNGKVIGVEHIEELCALARKNIKKHHNKLLQTKRVEIVHFDARNGYLYQAPYDCINVGAATSLKTVSVLLEQLKVNGKLVAPVIVNEESNKQIMRVYTKHENGKVSMRDLVDVKFVPLTNEKTQRETEMSFD